jgi:hypothetical protein
MCNPAAFIKKYARKHNPLISFNYIRSDAARCARIVGAPQFDVDLNGGVVFNQSHCLQQMRVCLIGRTLVFNCQLKYWAT